jgi:hypothetical protein
MQSLHIIGGFSDIKSQFIKKYYLERAPVKLRLWFSIEDQIVYVHDYKYHNKCMMVAVFDGLVYESRIDIDRVKRLVNYAFDLSKNKNNDIADELNNLYASHGAF